MGRGPKRKYANGIPDRRYWGPGFYENLRNPPARTDVRVFEVRPVQGRDPDILPSRSTRSLEIIKDPGTEEIRILASASAADSSYPAETGHDCAEISPAAPDWAHKDGARCFDAELASQLNFAPLEPPRGLADQLARTIASRTDEGIWAQMVFEIQEGRLAECARNTHTALSKACAGSDETAGIARRLEPLYAARAATPLCALSIRGALLSDDRDATLDSIEAILGSIEAAGDTLSTHLYPVESMLPWLESRQLCSEGAYGLLEANAAMWGDMTFGRGRDMTPIIAVSRPELATLVRIPSDPTLSIGYRRQRRGGAEEAVLGYDLASADYGELADAPSSISPAHAGAHTYVLGGTGTGKTSLLRSLARHMCSAKERRALIVIDVKDDDALSYLTQMSPDELASGNVTYIDVNRTDFAINPLELPPHDPARRDTVAARKAGQVTSMLREVYSQHSVFVQVERLIRLLLEHLFSRSASPSMSDLYAVIMSCLNDPTAAARRLATSSPELQDALSSLAKMPRDSWIPLINRIEPFAVNAYMRRRFGGRHTTIDFAKMLEPGHTTIFCASEAETPPQAHPIIPTLISLGVWNALLERHASGEPKTSVSLFLDEVHMMRDVGLLETMVSRGRSMGLGLVISHQNLSQLNQSIVDSIVGNSMTHIHGRLMGTDARKVAAAIDPSHAAALTDQLSGLPNHEFLISRVPPEGAERSPPSPFAAHAPPPRLLGDHELAPFLKKMSSLHRPSEDAASTPLDAWRSELAAPLPSPLEWHIIIAMRNSGSNVGTMANSAVAAGLIRERHEISRTLKSMGRRGLVVRNSNPPRSGSAYPTHELTPEARRAYLPTSFGAIGRADGIEETASAAFEHYVSRGLFVAIAAQGRTFTSKNTVDMIAYDYATDRAYSVEVESAAEVKSNPEHVLYNMSKWEEMGFVGCDTWSAAPAIADIRGRLGEPLRAAVRCFVPEAGAWVSQSALDGKEAAEANMAALTERRDRRLGVKTHPMNT